MGSHLPALAVWVLIVSASMVAGARMLLLTATLADQRLNTGLVFIILCCLLRRPAVIAATTEMTGSETVGALVAVLGEVMIIPAAGTLFLLAVSWLNRTEPPYFGAAVHVLAVACSAVVFTLSLWARACVPHGPEIASWQALSDAHSTTAALICAAFHDTLIDGCAVMLIYICTQELRCRFTTQTAIVCGALIIVSAGALAQTTSMSLAVFLGSQGEHHTIVDSIAGAGDYTTLLFAYALAGAATIPLVGAVLQRVGLDKYSRRQRQLLPLWRDLTYACPEIVHTPNPEAVNHRSRYALHRIVVEIRDSVLILSRYARRHDESLAADASCTPSEREAIVLALAWRAKIGGQAAVGDASLKRSAANELFEESEELAAVARHWSIAKSKADALLRSDLRSHPTALGDAET